MIRTTPNPHHQYRRPLLAPRRSFYVLAEALQASLDDAQVATSSRRTYGFHATTLQNFFGAERPLDSITAQDVEAFRMARVELGRKPATVNREIAFLSRTFSLALHNGKTYTNPVAGMRRRLLRENNERSRYLTRDEEEQLKKVLSVDDFRIVRVALLSGMRRGEVFSLRREDVRFEIRFIYLRQTKNGCPRWIPMNPELMDLLGPVVRATKPGAYLFKPKAMHRESAAAHFVRRVFRPACAKAGIVDLKFHDLRHTTASRMVMAGAGLPTVQVILGHKTERMTKRYTHLSPDYLLKEIQRLN